MGGAQKQTLPESDEMTPRPLLFEWNKNEAGGFDAGQSASVRDGPSDAARATAVTTINANTWSILVERSQTDETGAG